MSCSQPVAPGPRTGWPQTTQARNRTTKPGTELVLSFIVKRSSRNHERFRKTKDELPRCFIKHVLSGTEEYREDCDSNLDEEMLAHPFERHSDGEGQREGQLDDELFALPSQYHRGVH